MTVLCTWVKATYNGDMAKKVLELANKGVGYIELDQGKGCATVAFRCPLHQVYDKEVATDREQIKYDETFYKRTGMEQILLSKKRAEQGGND